MSSEFIQVTERFGGKKISMHISFILKKSVIIKNAMFQLVFMIKHNITKQFPLVLHLISPAQTLPRHTHTYHISFPLPLRGFHSPLPLFRENLKAAANSTVL